MMQLEILFLTNQRFNFSEFSNGFCGKYKIIFLEKCEILAKNSQAISIRPNECLMKQYPWTCKKYPYRPIPTPWISSVTNARINLTNQSSVISEKCQKLMTSLELMCRDRVNNKIRTNFFCVQKNKNHKLLKKIRRFFVFNINFQSQHLKNPWSVSKMHLEVPSRIFSNHSLKILLFYKHIVAMYKDEDIWLGYLKRTLLDRIAK